MDRMDCTTARLSTTLLGRRGAELSTADTAALESHLAGCAACSAFVQGERAFDDRMAELMNRVVVPVGLKEKILDGVSAQRAVTTRRWTYGSAAIAAAILFSIGGWVAYRIASAPVLDFDRLLDQADEQVRDPESHAQSFLARKRTSFNPERPFDWNLLATVGTGDLQGRELPMLYFRNVRKNCHARVFVVRDTDFNWKSLRDRLREGTMESSNLFGHQVAILEDAVRGDVGYVVVFTGESVESFLDERTSR